MKRARVIEFGLLFSLTAPLLWAACGGGGGGGPAVASARVIEGAVLSNRSYPLAEVIVTLNQTREQSITNAQGMFNIGTEYVDERFSIDIDGYNEATTIYFDRVPAVVEKLSIALEMDLTDHQFHPVRIFQTTVDGAQYPYSGTYSFGPGSDGAYSGPSNDGEDGGDVIDPLDPGSAGSSSSTTSSTSSSSSSH